MTNPAGETVLSYNHEQVGVIVMAVGTKVELLWTDHVANEWTETFETLPLALARLATLIHCVENGRMFSDPTEGGGETPAEFVQAATRFLDSVTAP